MIDLGLFFKSFSQVSGRIKKGPQNIIFLFYLRKYRFLGKFSSTALVQRNI